MRRGVTRRQRGGFLWGTPKIDLVLSRYKEKLDWIHAYDRYKIHKVHIYNKSETPIQCPTFKDSNTECEVHTIENVGVCDHTYLYHIVKNYHKLADITVFAPGSSDIEYKKPILDFTLEKTFTTKNTVLNTYDFKVEVGDAMYNFLMPTYPTKHVANREEEGRAPQKLAEIRPFGAWYHANFPDVHVTKSTFFGIMAVSKKHILQRSRAFYRGLLNQVNTEKFHETSHFMERSWQAIFQPLPDACLYTSMLFDLKIGKDQGAYMIMRRPKIKFAVMGIFKNESMGIREWVDHYLWQGADEILLLDNDSTDGGAGRVAGMKNVTVLPAPKQHVQSQNYNEVGYPWLKKAGVNVLTILDIDEYMFGTDGKNLKQHVTDIFTMFMHPSQVSCKWSMFGSSGYVKQPKSIRTSFTWKKRDLDTNVKSIMWLDDVQPGGLDLHSSVVKGATVESPPGIQLNHYTIQSKEYFEKVKMHRGDATTPITSDLNRRDWAYFNKYDYHEVEDASLKNLVLLKTNAPDFDTQAVYKKNIYTKEEFDKIFAYTTSIHENEMKDDVKASGRLMYEIPSTNNILHTIYNASLMKKIHRMTGNMKLKPCYKVPVEYRKYVVGSSMDWHTDTQILPEQQQFECVVTLTNTSDSKTVMEYTGGKKELHTPPNSLLIVRANGIRHMVTKVKKGERTILKFVLCE